jgi:hypothetical protein
MSRINISINTALDNILQKTDLSEEWEITITKYGLSLWTDEVCWNEIAVK